MSHRGSDCPRAARGRWPVVLGGHGLWVSCVLNTQTMDSLTTALGLFILSFFRKVDKFHTPNAGNPRNELFPERNLVQPPEPFCC